MKCPNCGFPMRKSSTSHRDEHGNCYTTYICDSCKTITKVKE